MKVEVKSQEVHYSITYTELCDLLKIPDTDKVDFINVELDPANELIIISQIEPKDVARPKGDNEK